MQKYTLAIFIIQKEFKYFIYLFFWGKNLSVQVQVLSEEHSAVSSRLPWFSLLLTEGAVAKYN